MVHCCKGVITRVICAPQIWNERSKVEQANKKLFYRHIYFQLMKSFYNKIYLKITIAIRAPDKMRKMNFNRRGLLYFLTESYVWPLVRIVSMRRFLQVVKHRILSRNRRFRNENTHLIWCPSNIWSELYVAHKLHNILSPK